VDGAIVAANAGPKGMDHPAVAPSAVPTWAAASGDAATSVRLEGAAAFAAARNLRFPPFTSIPRCGPQPVNHCGLRQQTPPGGEARQAEAYPTFFSTRRAELEWCQLLPFNPKSRYGNSAVKAASTRMPAWSSTP